MPRAGNGRVTICSSVGPDTPGAAVDRSNRSRAGRYGSRDHRIQWRPGTRLWSRRVDEAGVDEPRVRAVRHDPVEPVAEAKDVHLVLLHVGDPPAGNILEPELQVLTRDPPAEATAARKGGRHRPGVQLATGLDVEVEEVPSREHDQVPLPELGRVRQTGEPREGEDGGSVRVDDLERAVGKPQRDMAGVCRERLEPPRGGADLAARPRPSRTAARRRRLEDAQGGCGYDFPLRARRTGGRAEVTTHLQAARSGQQSRRAPVPWERNIGRDFYRNAYSESADHPCNLVLDPILCRAMRFSIDSNPMIAGAMHTAAATQCVESWQRGTDPGGLVPPLARRCVS
jgi:hypothetical protein